MNILLVSGPGISLKEPYNSGIEAFIVSLANQLVDDGHVVDVVAHEAEAASKFNIVNPFKAEEVDFFIHPLDKQQIKLSNEKRQFKDLDVSAYDVIHYNMFYPHLLEAGLSFNTASILTLHSPADENQIAAYKTLSQRSDIQLVAISKKGKQQSDQAIGMDMPLVSFASTVNIQNITANYIKLYKEVLMQKGSSYKVFFQNGIGGKLRLQDGTYGEGFLGERSGKISA